MAFFLQSFSNVFLIADYYVNTEKYAKKCYNKIHGLLHCNGKCQLAKKLKEEAKKDQQNPERKSENKQEITLFATDFATDISYQYNLPTNTKKKLPLLTAGNPIDRAFAIFRPPKVIS